MSKKLRVFLLIKFINEITLKKTIGINKDIQKRGNLMTEIQ